MPLDEKINYENGWIVYKVVKQVEFYVFDEWDII